MVLGVGWRTELGRWLAPFLEALGHPARRVMCPLYVAGLIGPGERKSVQPMAERLGLPSHDALHHFIAGGTWDLGPLEATLVVEADRLVGGPDAVLVIDDTALPKKGRASVGVAPQYATVLGKNANCQTLVSLTLARAEVPVPVALRLFLPEGWISDPARLDKVGVPEAWRTPRTRPELALDELDRVVAAGVRFGCVLADAGYGVSASFRQGLSTRGMAWAVGIPRILKVYPADVALLAPPPGGRRRLHAPDQLSRSAEEVLADAPWRAITWRRGTKGRLTARFAALRIRVADGQAQQIGGRPAQHLPGEEAWVVGERRASGETKYHLSNLPADTSLKALAGAIKARWTCEQAHQQLKEELGLDHFEGRSWTGLHRHALMTMLALAFLQHRRLAEAGRGGKSEPDHRRSPACPPCAKHSSPICSAPERRRDARTAAGGSVHRLNQSCQSSASHGCWGHRARPRLPPTQETSGRSARSATWATYLAFCWRNPVAPMNFPDQGCRELVPQNYVFRCFCAGLTRFSTCQHLKIPVLFPVSREVLERRVRRCLGPQPAFSEFQ